MDLLLAALRPQHEADSIIFPTSHGEIIPRAVFDASSTSSASRALAYSVSE